ncbi:hypothetical protein [Streptomyces zhihengii]|uniref:Lipoprotein n=1 Tax=Streptomyces zhihengii TaxID=1818004 RepID=A0ABS2V4X0_9ACTN|nr:hypothetical protein [Streptomyces zhihengii]MBM9624773.1 hypothetical protein [Streptomyces zhihengii]
MLFLLAGASACTSPGQRELKKVATSDEVQQKRERAERELRRRAATIVKSGPWGPAARITVADSCAQGGGKNYLDRNAPKQPVLFCIMRLHLYFVVDRPVPEVLNDLRAMKVPTAWSEGSLRSAQQYLDSRAYEGPYPYPPSIGSFPGGEGLSWDAPGANPRTRLAEQCPGHKAVFRTCVSEPADLTLATLRERPGTLFEWTLHAGYHTVPGT